jgi:lysozyme
MIQKKGQPLSEIQNPAPDERLVAFVKEQEGFTPNRFSDYAQDSIGYGTRAKPGERAITKADADARLRQELAVCSSNVDRAIVRSGMHLTPNQRAALISFDFNTGDGAHLIAISQRPSEISARLPLWNKVTKGGRKIVSAGLVNRRNAELALFNS